MNTYENEYEEGYELGKKDVGRFGSIFAMDKATMFEGDFERGYQEGVLGNHWFRQR